MPEAKIWHPRPDNSAAPCLGKGFDALVVVLSPESPRWCFRRVVGGSKRQKGEKVDFSTFSTFLVISAKPTKTTLFDRERGWFFTKVSKTARIIDFVQNCHFRPKSSFWSKSVNNSIIVKTDKSALTAVMSKGKMSKLTFLMKMPVLTPPRTLWLSDTTEDSLTVRHHRGLSGFWHQDL